MKPALKPADIVRSIGTPHPGRDWTVVLVLLMVIFIGLVSYATYLFIGIRWGAVTGVSEAARIIPPTITRGELDAALAAYRVRKANFESRNFGIPGVTDPSK